MKVLSELLLEFYRLAHDASATEFQTRALDRVREVFDFDSAFWATGVVKPDEGVTTHSTHLYRQPPEMLESWKRINQNVAMTFEAFRQQGTTINAALCEPDWQSRYSPEGRAHIKRYGKAHCLLTIVAEPVLQIWTGVGLYRADPKKPFTEEQRALKQLLMPHFAEGWNISRFGLLNSIRNEVAPSERGRAISDSRGVLYNADRNFAAFMRSEWPDWQGPQLPSPLVEILSGDGRRSHVGNRAVFSTETVNNMELLSARELSKINSLSTRERDVARLFAEGADYRAIADALHIAPTTVRNHLQKIYAKLGVTNKIEMARQVLDDEVPGAS